MTKVIRVESFKEFRVSMIESDIPLDGDGNRFEVVAFEDTEDYGLVDHETERVFDEEMGNEFFNLYVQFYLN